MVPTGKREAVVDVLEDEGIDYALSEEGSGRDYAAIVSFPLPTAAVEPILEQLREAGLERDAYTVVIDAETVVSTKFDQLSAEWTEEKEEDSDRIAREELVTKAAEMAPGGTAYAGMIVASALVATAGLLLDSPAVVVGSMVIAPLVGPAMSTSVATVVDDGDMFVRGVKRQALGTGLGIAAAAAFAFVLHTTNIVPLTIQEVFAIGEVKERLAPDVLSLVIALAAGAAGAISISSGISTAVVGVMIAAALVPPMGVVGIGIAWGHPQAILGSFILVLVNVLSINLAALSVLWWQGYRPKLWFQEENARTTTFVRIATLAAVLIFLSGYLGGVTLSTYRTATFEKEAKASVGEFLEGEQAELLSMDIRYAGFPLPHPSRVVVTIGYPPGDTPPRVADDVGDRIRTAAPPPIGPLGNGDIVVEVRYVATETATAESSITAPSDLRDGGRETQRRHRTRGREGLIAPVSH
jgi:uncharacterized hydrophobic protein (TIGR00341 family)